MRPLSKIQTLIYYIGGILLVVGAMMPAFSDNETLVPYVFTSGAVMFAAMQTMQRYEGNDLTVRRLRRQQILGAMALVVAGLLMFCDLYGWLPVSGAEWHMALSIGALLHVYTCFRNPAALEKVQGK